MHMSIEIDDETLKEAMEFSKIKTKNEIVVQAVRELISIHVQKEILKLRGKIRFADDYVYKS